MSRKRLSAIRNRSTLLLAIVLTSGCMTASSLAASSNGTKDTAQKIVAVGDIHGAHDAFVGLLHATNLIDASENWLGGDTHFVSLGDILDRGADSRKSMDLLMKLQTQAAQAGGEVHVVAGNHELMNVMGDLRYVSVGEYAAFADDETDAMRRTAFQSLTANADISQGNFEQTYPKGYFAHRAAFAPDGKYGKWLLSLPALSVVNETAFVHGGLPEIVANSGLVKTNKSYRSSLAEFMDVRQQLISDKLLPNDEMQDLTKLARHHLRNKDLNSSQKRKLEKFIHLEEGGFLGSTGPVWYRGAMMCRPLFEKPILEASLEKLGAKRVIVGHTPSADGQVHPRYNGKLIQLDTGMLVSHYKGRPSALVINGDEVTVQYLNPVENGSLSDERISPAVLARPEIEAALAHGNVQIVAQGGGDGASRVKISHGANAYDGLFYKGDREVAAYQLDQLLGFDIVPPTAKRTVNALSGSLQIVYANAVSDKARRKDSISIGGWCPIPRQYQLMLAFDVLTANAVRTGDNLFYRLNQGLIYVSDFDGAFGASNRLPSGINRDAVQLTGGIRQALAGLDEAGLKTAMNGVLSAKEMEALLARRDAMLKKFK